MNKSHGGARAGAGRKPVAGEAKRKLNLHLTPELIARLDELGEHFELSRSQVVQLLLDAGTRNINEPTRAATVLGDAS